MADQDARTFGEMLRRHRLAAGLTQAELAERAGLSVRGINDLERGARQHPRPDTRTLLADALGLAGDDRAAFAAAARGQVASAVSLAVAQSAPRPLPTGTVTFFFTDIEGSTHLLQQLGSERYAALRAEHQRLLREAFAAYGGHEVDSQGDSFFVAFPTATGAVAAAVAAQRALVARPWPDGTPMQVRMGLHTGTPLVTPGGGRGGSAGGYIGLDVHRAARIAAAGHGGQVLLSETTRALVAVELPEGVTLRELGAHRLKDLQRPEPLAQLVVEGLPADFPPLATLDAHPNNLPIQLTSFVGREHELAHLKALLPVNRLVTLTGPGGTGKTRLALRMAADVVDAFAGGVWLVELAPLADSALVPQAVATALRLRDQPGRKLLDVLLDFLRPKTLLLVLDNCEHLVAACAQLAETLLQAAPGLQILASSREALGVAGETPYRVPSLPLPDPVHPEHPLDVEVLARNDSVHLFVERAVTAYPPFHLTAKNAPAVGQICTRLDGIPLALELAAARTRLFPPDQLVARLDDRFRLLTAGSRTALPRHQTLLALIEWSHNLLSEAERVLLRRLSVFAGGWSLEAAQAVCGNEFGVDVLETLAHLADKSLVEVEAPSEAAEARYRLLETIRQYAREKLVAAGEMEAVRDRHLGYCLRLAEAAEPKLRTAEQLDWLGRLEAEHDNLRTALAWALEGGTSDQALRLAGALFYFWVIRGDVSEGQKWLGEALVRAEREQRDKSATGHAVPTREAMAHRAKALHGTAWWHLVTLDATTGRTVVAEALRLWRELGDTWWIAVGLELEALMMSFQQELEPALACLEEGVALAREIEDPWALATCLIRFGDALKPAGEAAVARPYLEEGVALARRVGDRILLSEGLRELGSLYYAEGDFATGASLTAEALANGRAIGSVPHIFLALFQSVVVACLQGDPAKAKAFCLEIPNLGDVGGSPFGAAFILACFGLTACFGGEPEKGVRVLAVAIRFVRQAGMDPTSATDDPTSKVFMQALEQAQAQLGPEAFQAAWAEGLQMPVEQALALATADGSVAAPSPTADAGPA